MLLHLDHRRLLLHHDDGLLDGLLLACACVDPVDETSDAGATSEDGKNNNEADVEGPAAALCERFLSTRVWSTRCSHFVNDAEEILIGKTLADGFLYSAVRSSQRTND